MKIKFIFIFSLLLSSLMTTGCGQSGKLYLPNNPNRTATFPQEDNEHYL